jgi:hypothetical protein
VFIEHKLAFWHADLLCRMAVLKRLADIYELLADGEMAAVYDIGGRRNYFNSRRHRFWELAGYTTRAASENQYFNGTGWWRCFDQHINGKLAFSSDSVTIQNGYSNNSGYTLSGRK